ncbi:MAG: acetyl-CoA carboxylase carboxyltransferase subunit alpha [Candidatus Omnitrophica bacterium]|nr:acetyl-CoA carboxylase carboxyltransferase subunit alpha [Candidatus Omnitrophota bacterium]
MANSLDFEKPIIELEEKIKDLREMGRSGNMDLSSEINNLEKKLGDVKTKIFAGLTAWQRVKLARHPLRPYTLDYINLIMTDFIELCGDRTFADDPAIVGGLAKFNGEGVVVLGHQKGRDTRENIQRNFGMAHPEGYRKALRLMKLAEKFNKPVISFLDTPAAYPGVGAEERGQAAAIAHNLKEMSELKVPIIVVVIGEGGSGGALGIGVGDRIYMLEYSIYSVCPPEACAAILWRDRAKAGDAAKALALTSKDLLKTGIIDEIIPEPLGGAHRQANETALKIKEYLIKGLQGLRGLDHETLLKLRYEKYRCIGSLTET